jgi:cell filamentation protein, protein adenylyltransferase
MSATTGSSDPYLYPGTTVLKNLRGLTDPQQLEEFEARSTVRRLAELIERPISGKFDVAHLKAIHHYIFQDVFQWAGGFRTVDISKGGHLFARAAFLESAVSGALTDLGQENYLAGLDMDEFAERAAHYLGELNAAHPFREGNGRAQREFIRELGLRVGHYVDWRATTPQEMIEASRVSHATGNASPFTKVIRKCMGPAGPPAAL